jgi:hypothetical protein
MASVRGVVAFTGAKIFKPVWTQGLACVERAARLPNVVAQGPDFKTRSGLLLGFLALAIDEVAGLFAPLTDQRELSCSGKLLAAGCLVWIPRRFAILRGGLRTCQYSVR